MACHGVAFPRQHTLEIAEFRSRELCALIEERLEAQTNGRKLSLGDAGLKHVCFPH